MTDATDGGSQIPATSHKIVNTSIDADIHLREIGTSNSDYQTTSLGVSFVMDGIPMSNDAGMTYNSGTTVGNNISLNRGVDMRTMPTDEIASVEIQQGIPSVEYGDLTSGLIKIKRKEGAPHSNPLPT